MEIRKVDGSLYDKEISKNEEQFLTVLQDDGYSFRLIRHYGYQPYYRIEKDGISVEFKIYTDPKIKVSDQIVFFNLMFDLTRKVTEMEAKS